MLHNYSAPMGYVFSHCCGHSSTHPYFEQIVNLMKDLGHFWLIIVQQIYINCLDLSIFGLENFVITLACWHYRFVGMLKFNEKYMHPC